MSGARSYSVAVAAADDRGLDGEVSQHFGRCPYYTVAEIEDGRIGAAQVVANPNVARHQPGAMPHFIKGLGADVVIAGGMGPRAISMFESLGVHVTTGAQGSARAAVEAYIAGELSGTAPCESHGDGGCGEHDHHHGHHDKAAAGIIAVSAKGAARGLDAALDPRFGRAERFVLVDSATGRVLEEIDNPAVSQSHGAGPAASSIVAGRGATTVVSGRFGPSAAQALAALGVSTVEAPDAGTVVESLRRLFGPGWGQGQKG